MKIQAPKGTRDLIPAESYKWQYIEKKIRELTALYNIREIRTPIFEHTGCFCAAWATPQTLCKRRCILFDDRAGALSRCGRRARQGRCARLSSTGFAMVRSPRRCSIWRRRFSAMKSPRPGDCASITSLASRFLAQRMLLRMRRRFCLHIRFLIRWGCTTYRST